MTTLHGILRYDGTTGAFVGVFVPGGSGGLAAPTGLVFGPDGILYVSDSDYFRSTPAVLRFQGPAGPTPGAFIDAFVPAGRGGLLQPFAVLFGPDRTGDGRQDLYVTSADVNDSSFMTAMPHTSSVKVYDGVTGTYLADFVSAGSGGLNEPILMTFTETDPVTLAYRGGNVPPPAATTTRRAAPGTYCPGCACLTVGSRCGSAERFPLKCWTYPRILAQHSLCRFLQQLHRSLECWTD